MSRTRTGAGSRSNRGGRHPLAHRASFGSRAVDLGYAHFPGTRPPSAERPESWTSGPIAVGTYTFLGMLDVDDNGAESRDPDPGDPVTLPLTNQFDIVADQETAIDVVFELVYF